MKTLVIYKSLTGFTKKYAKLISKKLSCDIIPYKKTNLKLLNDYDQIIFGGSLHASGILGIKLIQKNLEKLENKKIIIFAVGATPNKPDLLKKLLDSNFTKEQQKKIKLFYLRGGFNYNKLNFLNKLIMRLLKSKLQKKKHKTNDDKGMLAAFVKPIDFVNEKNIKNLIKCALN